MRAARFPQCEEKIAQRTLELVHNATGVNPPVRAHGGLPGKEDQTASAGDRCVREPRWRGEPARVDPIDAHAS